MIATTSIGALLVRTMFSLVIVLGIVAVAYVIARRRSGGMAPVASDNATRSRFGRRPSAPAAIEVVGRVGLTRGTAAVAVRFGDRVVLVAAAEQGPSTVITEMPAAEWDECRTVREPIDPTPVRPELGTGAIAPRPNLVEALRQATARHA